MIHPTQPNPDRSKLFGSHVTPKAKKPTLAEKLRAYRATLRDEGREPVDTFFHRGESTARFAYFD